MSARQQTIFNQEPPLLPEDDKWLGGHFRHGNQVFKGGGTFCAGCGDYVGPIDELPDGYRPEDYIPRPEPAWPYKHQNCRVCKGEAEKVLH